MLSPLFFALDANIFPCYNKIVVMKTCAITGHRVLPENFNRQALYDELELLIRDGCDTFLCGMAEGFDLTCLDCLVSLRRKYRISTEACIPFPEQDKYFSKENKRLYRFLLEECDKKTILNQSYFSGCFLLRDRYMVDHCDFLYAYCTKDRGGAHYTLSYAVSVGVPVLRFHG